MYPYCTRTVHILYINVGVAADKNYFTVYRCCSSNLSKCTFRSSIGGYRGTIARANSDIRYTERALPYPCATVLPLRRSKAPPVLLSRATRVALPTRSHSGSKRVPSADRLLLATPQQVALLLRRAPPPLCWVQSIARARPLPRRVSVLLLRCSSRSVRALLSPRAAQARRWRAQRSRRRLRAHLCLLRIRTIRIRTSWPSATCRSWAVRQCSCHGVGVLSVQRAAAFMQLGDSTESPICAASRCSIRSRSTDRSSSQVHHRITLLRRRIHLLHLGRRIPDSEHLWMLSPL